MIKNILIKGEIAGRGVVNFDSTEQRFILGKHGIFTGLNDNVKLGKKVFTKTGKTKEDGTEIYDYKLKISGDCLRNAIFSKDVDVVNGVLIQNPFVLNTYMLSPVGLMRGYMFATKEKTIKRKSPLTITDAVQCNDVKSEMEIGSTTGERSDISMYFSEKVGDIKYSFSGQIDIKSLQFMSADPFFDRMSIDSDFIDSGESDIIIGAHYGKDAKADYGIFSATSKFTSKSYGEYGILFDRNICENVIKHTLKNMLAVNIVRNNAFASLSSLKIKLVDNIIGDGQKMSDDENWIELKTDADVDKLDLSNMYQFFEKADEDAVNEREEMIKKHAIANDAKSKEKKVNKSATQK